ncbi:MAG TPA: penicillin-binding protein, partial [Acidimicrobiaceae bacterium]|nr:penicillin-binding protein [Acidimicrobiaceae bacterium]
KTGTTQDYRDAWFVGFTPQLTTAVWMGYPDVDEAGRPRFMRDVRGRDVTGGSFPAQIWRTFMEAAVGGADHGDFPRPTFTGEALNPDLTTTTEPPTTRQTTTTEPDETTTTEADDDDPDEDGTSTTTTTRPRTTTTTAPSTTTTTTAPTTTAPTTTTTSPAGGVIDGG